MRGLLTVTLLVVLATLLPAGRAGEPSVGGGLSAEGLERRVRAVYERVRTALIHCDFVNGQPEDALVVTAEGHVLLPGRVLGKRFNGTLADGRRVSGIPLGWSEEWLVGVVKLEGPGPGLYVKLEDGAQVRAGQQVVTFGYSPLDATLVPEPMPGIARVNRVAPGA
jgi:hypothetical protein